VKELDALLLFVDIEENPLILKSRSSDTEIFCCEASVVNAVVCLEVLTGLLLPSLPALHLVV
jgi:hypothetical protein